MTADPDDREPAPDMVADTAMATGNDDGEPGDLLGDGTLDREEQAVLAELRHGGGEVVVTEAEEDSPAMADAVEDDSVVRGED